MKTRILFLFSAIFLLASFFSIDAKDEWIVYNKSNSGLPTNQVSAIGIDGEGNKWFGTLGVAKFDDSDWTVYDTVSFEVRSIKPDLDGNIWFATFCSFDDSGGIWKYNGADWTRYTVNSGLPDNHVHSIAIDGDGNKWFATSKGITRYDGSNWTVYDPSNSELPSGYISTIAIDGDGNKWIGTIDKGAAKFNNSDLTVYDRYNSGLPHNYVKSIAIDGEDNIWFGTKGGGAAKFDGTDWTVYNTSNSGLPENFVHSIAIDGYGNIWFGTNKGATKFDGTDWTTYKKSNSGLPDDDVRAIAIDGEDNKWFGTSHGGVGVLLGYSISTERISGAFCKGEDINIDFSFTALCEFNEGNVFTAQLSDAGGDFSNPVEIGTLSSDKPGTIEAVIPGATPAGTGYRIRVISSDPIKIGNDNGKNIIIFPLPTKPTITEEDDILTSSSTTGNQWYFNGELIQGAAGETYDTKQAAGVYTVQFTDENGCVSETSDEFDFISGVDYELISEGISVYPNPFSQSLIINYQLSNPGHASLNVYDIFGKQVAELIDDYLPAGTHSCFINSANLSPGIYYCTLKTGAAQKTIKLILLR